MSDASYIPLYDSIGKGYAGRRQPDPRIAAQLHAGLYHSDSIGNIGAGTGSYEIPGRTVVAVEPSMEMVLQRAPSAAPAVRAVAERLPLRDNSVDAMTALLTIHHWTRIRQGLDEMGRVARRQVLILTWDPDASGFWLTDEYFPAIAERDRRRFPALSELSRVFGRIDVQPVPVPHDCIDGFLGAYWRRPTAYLDPGIRAAMSGFVDLPDGATGIERLRQDLQSGEWGRRFRTLARKTVLDIGYRLVSAELR